jgi:cellulose synthase/poly-beta-1,6-N-acetylglucosamine synthase-like glycosyltransferase
MWWLTIPVAIYSAGIFALWLILPRKRGKGLPALPGSARVSVVVAARNEEKTIVTLLETLAQQDYPPDLF